MAPAICSNAHPEVTPTVVQSDDGAFVYLETSLNLIGSYRSHLDVFSQGGLRMLIYRKPDFTGFVDELL